MLKAVVASAFVLATQGAWVVRDSFKGTRLVSNVNTCANGRVEIYDGDQGYGWGTFADCGYYGFDTYVAETLCQGWGFANGYTAYYESSTSFETYGYTDPGETPTYCVTEDASCSLLDDDFCEECYLTEVWDTWSSCTDVSSTCHNSDMFIVCDGTTTRTCESLTGTSLSGQSGKDCEDGYWSDVASAIATIFIVLIVIGVVIFLGIIGCIVCCVCGGIACCAASAKNNNP